MAIFKCKMCGGSLDISEGITVVECDYCGTRQTVPTAKDENLQSLYNRANTLRIKSEFDKAEQLYEKILQADEAQAEAYWGLILCKYGIEYVEDPATFKRMPTCHRASFDSIIADEDYKSALKYADESQKSVYEAEAKEIDRIQKEIVKLSSKEEPYDVFICYKETDETGKRTQDSVIANDIYYQLTNEGFKVFYAAITLEDKLGSAYEPCIFAALNSAKVMLSIGTKPEYFNAVWVKNEWSRYLKLMKSDRSRLLIPCYKDMDAYELPEEFSHLQAQDMGKIGFINDVVRGIKKVLNPAELEAPIVKETVVSESQTNTTPLLKRAFMFLEDGNWANADEYCEKVLDIDPECAEAYLGKLMAELNVKKQESLKDQAEPFDTNINYQKTIRFASEKLKNTMVEHIESINTRNEQNRLEEAYQDAKNKMDDAEDEYGYSAAAEKFDTIPNYLDSAELASKCRKLAEIARKEAIYQEGCKEETRETIHISNKVFALEKAITKFEQIPEYKDSTDKISNLKLEIEELNKKIEAAKRRKKRITIIIPSIVCVFIAFIILLNTVIIPNVKYNNATTLLEKGNVIEAYEELVSLDGYKDSVEKATSIYSKYKIEKLKAAKIGDYVFFGSYEQDNDTSNGNEDVEWLVLEVKDGKALVISKHALDCKEYNITYDVVSWKTCSLRQWLNNGFIDSVFTAEEKAKILTVTVPADENPRFATGPGKATQDQIFLLSIVEKNKYFGSDIAGECKPTDYAVAKGAFLDSTSGNCCWWLRSPGDFRTSAAKVFTSGEVSERGSNVDTDHAVRPAMWIDIS